MKGLVLYWLILGCTQLLCCSALLGDRHYDLLNSPITEIDTFGFEEGGTLSLHTTLTVSNTNVTFFFCTDKEFDLINQDTVCSGLQSCVISDAPLDAPIQYVVKSQNFYHLLLVKCTSDNLVSFNLDYVLLNPGNQHLSLGYIPLPSVYIALTVVWTVIIVASGFYWWRNKAHVVVFHSLLGAVGILKLAVVSIALIYWEIFQDSGYPIVQLGYLQSFLFALSETAFFCALLLIAKGWRITRTSLPPSEIRTISVALVLLLSTLLFFSFYNEGYYFLSLMIMYFFMLPKIFTSITRNTRALQTQMLLMRYANSEVSTEPLITKMKMFKTLRTAVILYLGSILMVSSMRIIMLWYLWWVNYCVSEIISLVMVSVVVFLLRPRENGAFSTRAFLDGNPFPILNMQNLDHFDEFFGEQLLDPEMVLMNSGLRDNLYGPDIDMSTTIVVEYPSPPVLSGGKIVHFPRLSVGILDKQPEKGEQQSTTTTVTTLAATDSNNATDVNMPPAPQQPHLSRLSLSALPSPPSSSSRSRSPSSALSSPSSSPNAIRLNHRNVVENSSIIMDIDM